MSQSAGIWVALLLAFLSSLFIGADAWTSFKGYQPEAAGICSGSIPRKALRNEGGAEYEQKNQLLPSQENTMICWITTHCGFIKSRLLPVHFYQTYSFQDSAGAGAL